MNIVEISIKLDAYRILPSMVIDFFTCNEFGFVVNAK